MLTTHRGIMPPLQFLGVWSLCGSRLSRYFKRSTQNSLHLTPRSGCSKLVVSSEAACLSASGFISSAGLVPHPQLALSPQDAQAPECLYNWYKVLIGTYSLESGACSSSCLQPLVRDPQMVYSRSCLSSEQKYSQGYMFLVIGMVHGHGLGLEKDVLTERVHGQLVLELEFDVLTDGSLEVGSAHRSGSLRSGRLLTGKLARLGAFYVSERTAGAYAGRKGWELGGEGGPSGSGSSWVADGAGVYLGRVVGGVGSIVWLLAGVRLLLDVTFPVAPGSLVVPVLFRCSRFSSSLFLWLGLIDVSALVESVWVEVRLLWGGAVWGKGQAGGGSRWAGSGKVYAACSGVVLEVARGIGVNRAHCGWMGGFVSAGGSGWGDGGLWCLLIAGRGTLVWFRGLRVVVIARGGWWFPLIVRRGMGLVGERLHREAGKDGARGGGVVFCRVRTCLGDAIEYPLQGWSSSNAEEERSYIICNEIHLRMACSLFGMGLVNKGAHLEESGKCVEGLATTPSLVTGGVWRDLEVGMRTPFRWVVGWVDSLFGVHRGYSVSWCLGVIEVSMEGERVVEWAADMREGCVRGGHVLDGGIRSRRISHGCFDAVSLVPGSVARGQRQSSSSILTHPAGAGSGRMGPISWVLDGYLEGGVGVVRSGGLLQGCGCLRWGGEYLVDGGR
ncbi:hypothetical protein Tco_0427919 [Tanacetum coccineum]